jgi:hypothetical protein
MREGELSAGETQELRAETGLVWYTDLEKELSFLLSLIPPIGDQTKVYSPKCASLINEACSLLDSILKQVIASEQFNGNSEIQPLRSRIEEERPVNFREYRELFEGKLEISSEWIYLRQNRMRYYPFEEIAKGESPTWWQTYQGIKHNRFKNLERATLDQTVQAAMGVFMIMCNAWIYYEPLFKKELVVSTYDTPEALGIDLRNNARDVRATVIFRSDNFVYPYSRWVRGLQYKDLTAKFSRLGMII